MQAIWVLAVLALASADVSHLGYHYKVPQTSYGFPSYQLGGLSSNYQSGVGSSGASIYKGAESQYLGSSFSHGELGRPSHLSGDGQLSASALNGGIVSGLSQGVNSGAIPGYYSGFNNGYGGGYTGYGYSRYGGLASGLGGSGLSSGQFYQTGGSSTVRPLYLDSGLSSGQFYQTGGTSTVRPLYLDSGLSSGQFYETGGSSTVRPLYLDSGLSSGQYYQTGGSSTAKPIYLGGSNQLQTSQYNTGEKYYQQYYQVQSNEPTQVYKHFYVHAAPEEPELPKPRTPIVIPPPQKHYKIIFVKTPSVSSYSSQVVPVQQQTEEKTIVYVLSKKPEEHREVIVPKVEQKPPTKPEVYFIKYNNKEDSQAVINNIVNDYNKPGQSVSVSGGSGGSSVISGLPSLSDGSGYISGSSGLSDISTTNFVNIPSQGFSSGFSNYPTSTSFPIISNFGSGFSNPTSVVSTLSDVSSGQSSGFSGPSSLSTGGSTITSFPSDSAFNKFGSFSSGSDSGISSGSSLFGSSQSDSSVSSLGSSQSFGSSSSGASDSNSNFGAGDSSLFNGVSSPSVTTTSSVLNDLNSATGSQGLPHETYGVPSSFRIV